MNGEQLSFRQVGLGCQVATLGGFPHGRLSLNMALRMTSILRMQAVKATFLGFPASTNLWREEVEE
jgi:hypothetical protein